MSEELQGLEIVAGTAPNDAASGAPLMPFDGAVVSFLSKLSQAVLSSRNFRTHPEMIALAYWMRPARIKALRQDFSEKTSTGILVARGTAFHIAPANVDTIFLYSFILSLLAGNANIVRISSRDSGQMDDVLNLIRELLDTGEFDAVCRRLSIVRYERSEAITRILSDLCDIRVLWGGNVSVNAIRSLPLSPYATEMCFPDKTSIAVFDAAHISALPEADLNDLGHKFFNDTYVFGQMACSSPRLVVWRGETRDCEMASTRFWPAVEARVSQTDSGFGAIEFMNKLVGEQKIAASLVASILQTGSNQLTVNSLQSAADFHKENYCGSGFFSQAFVRELSELAPLASRDLQTIVSSGISTDEWSAFLASNSPCGVDRIVEPGEALTFAPVWDGLDLLREFSREITLAI